MANWTRKKFGSVGLTQVPTGPYLASLQRRHSGAVMLMIDVSGSMNGSPIRQAVVGAKAFVREAIEARYDVGVMLWNTTVVAMAEPTREGVGAQALLDKTSSASGGNALDQPLAVCHEVLNQFSGDRVCALFGDGDLTPKALVLEKVSVMKADNIRFVTRGLGTDAAREFAEISDEDPSSVEVESVNELASSIAGMAASLKKS